MSLFNKIKKYIAKFEADQNADELQIDGQEIEIDADAEETPASAQTYPDLEIDAGLQLDDARISEIFQKVIDVFNDSLPGFLKASVDSDKQKKYLYESLSSSLKSYLSDIEEEARSHGMAILNDEREEQNKQIEKLKLRAAELEKKRNELNDLHLSDGRQKRALSERVRDLEKQVIELEAEREQLNIENKSLVNRIKVTNVLESDIENMREELDKLRSNQQLDKLEEEISTLNADNAALKDKIANLIDEINNLEDVIKKKDEALETVKVKDEMGGAMLNDLQKLASEANKKLKEAENRISDLTDENSRKDEQLDTLKKQIAEKEGRLANAIEKLNATEQQLAEADANVAEAEENMSALNEIAQQIDAFSDLKIRLEDRIARQKEELLSLKSENQSLKETIKRNLLTEAEHNKSYQDEIDKLKEQNGDRQ